MKKFGKISIVLLILALVVACSPKKQPTPQPIKGAITGIVSEVHQSSFVLDSSDNHAYVIIIDTQTIIENDFNDDGLLVNDVILVDYVGDLTGSPIAEKIVVEQVKQPSSASSLTGKVVKVTDVQLVISGDTDESYIFSIDSNTVVENAKKGLVVKDVIEVTFMGNSNANPVLLEIKVLNDVSYTRKLHGKVRHLKGDLIVISADNGKEYTFNYAKAAVEGALAKHATVTISYIGNYKKEINAKVVKVTKAAPKPTPAPAPVPNPTVLVFTGTLQIQPNLGGKIAVLSVEDNKVYYFMTDDKTDMTYVPTISDGMSLTLYFSGKLTTNIDDPNLPHVDKAVAKNPYAIPSNV